MAHNQQSQDPLVQLAINVGLTAIAHPMGYVKTLIQIGYEPLPPQLGRNVFFRKTLQLPGVFAYSRHIYRVDGFLGLYRGFIPRLCGTVIGATVATKVAEKLDEFFPVPDENDLQALQKPDEIFPVPDENDLQALQKPDEIFPVPDENDLQALQKLDEFFPVPDENDLQALQKPDEIFPVPDENDLQALQNLDEIIPVPDENDLQALQNKYPVSNCTFVIETCKMTVSHSCAVIVTHPFHVIAVRSMAQFIGRESKYSGLLESYVEVYSDSGIKGFFVGLIPRLLQDVLTLWLARTLYQVINNLLLSDKVGNINELRTYAHTITGFLAGIVTYPLGLVSNMMAVNDSGLVAGSPPYMPKYSTWIDCLRDLSNKGLLKRGSSVLFRRCDPLQ